MAFLIQEYGMKIPADISIVGFDNIQLSNYINPPLTTVDQQINKLGEKAVEILLKLIDNSKKIFNEVIPTKLIIRKSCK